MVDRIRAFLRGAPPNAYCAACLAVALAIAQSDVIQRVARLIGAGEAVTKRGECTLCGGVRYVIAARQEVA
jgi:hypothetical protein